ncbi:Altronate dehydratase [Lactococcus lactis]|nr:Altronate dehydratase [Lactococcus lactis]
MICFEEILETAKNDHRENIPLSELKIGLKCGGSDGFSGITANPLIGMASDYFISQGASTVLTEVPEMFGAENRLMARAENETIFTNIVNLINDFKRYFQSYGQPVFENPSPVIKKVELQHLKINLLVVLKNLARLGWLMF